MQKEYGFEVYGPFGRLIERFTVGANELHHDAMERARQLLLKRRREGYQRTYIRTFGIRTQ